MPGTYGDSRGGGELCPALGKESCSHLQAWGAPQLSQEWSCGGAQGCLGIRLTQSRVGNFIA